MNFVKKEIGKQTLKKALAASEHGIASYCGRQMDKEQFLVNQKNFESDFPFRFCILTECCMVEIEMVDGAMTQWT